MPDFKNDSPDDTMRARRDEYIKNGSHDRSFELSSGKLVDEQLHVHDEKPRLNYHNLEIAADAIFKGRRGLPVDEYRRLSESFYASLNLNKRGEDLELWDARLLAKYLDVAHTAVTNDTDPNDRQRNMLVVGAGSGRLASTQIEIARTLGLEKIVFNDLYEQHVDQLRQKIEDGYKTDPARIHGIELEYVHGDILHTDFQQRFDLAVATWFVTAEIHDPSSPEACRRLRVEFYEKMKRLLIDGGVFIEDIPDTRSIGWLCSLRKKTRNILQEKGILGNEAGNYSLTYIPKEDPSDNPYHLRYAPFNGKHDAEIDAAGMNVYQANTETYAKTCAGIHYDIPVLLSNAKTVAEVHAILLTNVVHNTLAPSDETLAKHKQVCLLRATNF